MLLSYTVVILVSCFYFIVPRELDFWGMVKLGFIDTTYEFTKNTIINFSVLYMLPIQALWIILAIGPDVIVLNNKFTSFISNLSMEIYLSHMMAFRAIEKLHLSYYISNQEVEFWISAFMSLSFAIIFSYAIKYVVFPAFGKMKTVTR